MNQEILPAFEKNNVPVVFSSNEEFVPVMAVMIKSIIENSSNNRNYDVIILTRDISNDYAQKLQSMTDEKNNFSIRILDVSERIAGYNFYTANRPALTIETYFRLLLPELLPDYDKVVYLDGDMVANADVAELYDIDLTDYFLASSLDVDGVARCYKQGDDRKTYRENILHLKNLDNYFCAGMLVMNLEMFRKELPTQKLLEVATSFDWMQHDQDVLNMLCEEKTKLVGMEWDVLRDAGNNHFLPTEYYNEFLESEKNPKIIHYGGMRKPWVYYDVERGEYFWRYAMHTPFYREILSMVCDTNQRRYGKFWLFLKNFAVKMQKKKSCKNIKTTR